MAKQCYFYSDEFGTHMNILQVKIITNGNSIFFVSLMSELEIHQSKGFISKDVLILTLEDPKGGVGSGGATINALLVVTEHLRAKTGFQVCI